MSADVTIVAALLAGLLSFLSPCVLPLVPPYLVYLAGASLERLAGAEPEPRVRREAVLGAAIFVAGFSTVFVALGATASSIGQGLIALRVWFSGALGAIAAKLGLPVILDVDPFTLLAGVAIILMGLHFLNVFRFGWLMQERRVQVGRPVGLWGAYLMGLAFAFGWTPCIGPILAAILAVATAKETALKGAGLLAVYSAGLGIPFIIAAFAVEPFAAFLTRFKRHLGMVEKAMGVFLILTGVALAFTNAFADASAWLLEWFPALSKIG